MPLGKRIIKVLTVFCLLMLYNNVYAEDYEIKTQGSGLNDGSAPVVLNEAFFQDVIEAYSRSCITGTRIMMETGESARYRYEFVMRNGFDKLVSLKMPYRVTWYRYNDEGFIIMDGQKLLMEDKMKDLEDVFLEDLNNGISDGSVSEIQYSGIPAYYLLLYSSKSTYRVIMLQKSMQFIRLEKETSDKLTVMLYDNLNEGTPKDFLNQMQWYQDIPQGSVEDLENANQGEASEQISPPIDENPLLEDFQNLLKPALEKYKVQKTEMIEFPDATAMFITMFDDVLGSPFIIVIIIYDFPANPGNSQSILGKIPEDYNMCQKTIDNLEINVIGSQDKTYLEEISNLIINAKEE